MQRRVMIGWLGLLWFPVIALVLGVMAGCASTDASQPARAAAPAKADLRRLVAQALDADPPFDSFAAVASADAHRVAAAFRPVLADVTARECRPARVVDGIDCTLEVVLRFPAMGDRESTTTWERRLRRVEGEWRIAAQTAP